MKIEYYMERITVAHFHAIQLSVQKLIIGQIDSA